jgi:class 3 adenylate cyclase
MAWREVLWARARPLIELGISADTKPEDVKYIRLLNSIIFSGIFLLLPAYLILALVQWNLLMCLFALVTIAAAPFFIWLSKRGRHVAAALGLLVTYALFEFVMSSFVDDHRIVGYYGYILLIMITLLLLPRDRMKLMIGTVIVVIICIGATFILRRFFAPVMVLTEAQVEIFNTFIRIVIFSFMILTAIFFRIFINLSEGQFQAEREKSNLLANKLKLYLPHQFVETLASADAAPDYRRRRLTIFFSDVQGFTRWTDKLEPEDVREMLNRYLSEMSAIAIKWGGTIDKFIGDAMMIFFGDPEFTNDRDHARRCVRMALEMQGKMRELRARWENIGFDEPLGIKMGINTGYATVGNFGSENRLNYTALGSAVNLASRLQATCAPDRITISHPTYLLVEDEIACESRGRIEAKGFIEPVEIYEVVGVKSIPDNTTI